jgi:outer membrane protein assembly factor BamB
MNARIVLTVLVVSWLIVGCKRTSMLTPTETNSGGLQHTIAWPSLANSSWPMNHADPQSTGRSRYAGPSSGNLAWKYDTVYAEAGVVLANAATVVFCAIGTQPQPVARACLYMLDDGGALKDSTTMSASSVTPIAAADGTVFTAGYDGVVRAFSSNGSLKWAFKAGTSITLQGMNIGIDGILYFVTGSHTLYALTPAGQVAWQITDQRFINAGHGVLSFSPDGKTLYVPGGYHQPLLVAVDVSSHAVVWTFGNSDRDAVAPVVDSEGHIYMLGPGDTTHSKVPALYSLNPNGSVRWAFAHGNRFDISLSADPTIDINGNISFAMDTIYSVDYEGNLRWKMKLDSWADSPLVCDAAGNLYVTVVAASRATHTMAITSGGVEMWRYVYDVAYGSDSSPALTADGKLLLLDWRGRNLYCLN